MQSPDLNASSASNPADAKSALDAQGMQIALVVSRFNEEVTERLRTGAEEWLESHGCDATHRTLLHVPGAWELPLAAGRLAQAGTHDAIVALGSLVRGETSHFDVLAAAVAGGLQQVGREYGVPVIFGVLTTENLQQALDRAGDRHRNKGEEAAETAIEMVNLYRRINKTVAGSSGGGGR